MADTNQVSLLYFARRPTKTCIRLILLCVYVIVYNPHVVCPSLQEESFTSYMDNATAYFAMSLCCLLALAGFGLLWSMSYDPLREMLLTSGGQARVFLFKVLSVFSAVCFYALLSAGLCFATGAAQRVFARQFATSLLWMCDGGGSGPNEELSYNRHFSGYSRAKGHRHYTEDHIRYLSEDVQFLCEVDISDGTADDPGTSIMYGLWWTRDSDTTPINSSSRIIFDEHTGWNIEYKQTHDTPPHTIRATMLILRLTDSDFASYHCHAEVKKLPGKERTSLSGRKYDVISIHAGTFNLQRHDFGHEDFEMYPGQTLRITFDPWIITHEEGDIAIIHTVNSSKMQMNARVENRPELCTYTRSYRYRHITRLRDRSEDRVVPKLSRDVDLDSHIACVQFEDFAGVHSFVIRRHFYNTEIQGPDFVESPFPFTFSVRPSRELRHTLAFNESFFDKCWEGLFFTQTEHCLEWGYSMMETALTWYCRTWRLVAYAVPLAILYPYMKLTKVLFRFLCQGSFCPPVISTLCGLPFTQRLRVDYPFESHRPETAWPTGALETLKDTLSTRYDVFLAYSDATGQTAKSVRATLESYQLCVFDCQRDVPAGEPLLPAWDAAIEYSASFVVLASRHYTEDPELQTQFRAMHYRFLCHEVSEDKMLIILCDHVPVPRSLGPLPVIHVDHMTSVRQLEWWALAFASPAGRENILREIVHNARRDARDLLRRNKSILQVTTGMHHEESHEKTALVQASVNITPLGGEWYTPQDVSNTDNQLRPTGPVFGASDNNYQMDGERRGSVNNPGHPTDLSTPRSTRSPNSTTEPSNQLSRRGSWAKWNPFSLIAPLTCQSKGRCGANLLTCERWRRTEWLKDVFLTYCEDSDSDCSLAAKVKGHLEDSGLSVFDAVCDILAGKSETAVVAAAAQCASFVVLLSPVYRTYYLTRRLHFPQVLQALESGRVGINSVLIIRTGYGKNRSRYRKNGTRKDRTVCSNVEDRTCDGKHRAVFQNGPVFASTGSVTNRHHHCPHPECVAGRSFAAASAVLPNVSGNSGLGETSRSCESEFVCHPRTVTRALEATRFGAETEDSDTTYRKSFAENSSGGAFAVNDVPETRGIYPQECFDDNEVVEEQTVEVNEEEVVAEVVEEGEGESEEEGETEQEEDFGEEHYSLPDGLQGLTVISWTGGLADEDYFRYVSRWVRNTGLLDKADNQ